jgi:hypothetical protein
MSRSRIVLACLAALPLALAGCKKSEPANSTPPDQSAGQPATQPAWLLASAPEGALGVSEAKTSATEGQQIVLRGRVGGRNDPISADSPVFIVMDTAVASCADEPDESCPTPWDYCCETDEVKQAKSATIQLVDSSGALLEADLAGAGIKPLDEVIVVGSVAPSPAAGVLIVKATAVHVVRG